jgi:F-box-like
VDLDLTNYTNMLSPSIDVDSSITATPEDNDEAECLGNLPTELLFQIFSHNFSRPNLWALTQTCHRFRDICLEFSLTPLPSSSDAIVEKYAAGDQSVSFDLFL